MGEQCNDNRFELIEKYKQNLIEATNIETNADEMKVIGNILFRFWQMGWLGDLEEMARLKTAELQRIEEDNYVRALKEIISDMSDIGIDFSEQCAMTDSRKKSLNELIEKYGWALGIEQYYLEVSKND